MLSIWLHFQSRCCRTRLAKRRAHPRPHRPPVRHASSLTQGQYWPGCGQAAGATSKMGRWRFRHNHRKSGQGVPAFAGIGSRRGGRRTDLGGIVGRGHRRLTHLQLKTWVGCTASRRPGLGAFRDRKQCLRALRQDHGGRDIGGAAVSVLLARCRLVEVMNDRRPDGAGQDQGRRAMDDRRPLLGGWYPTYCGEMLHLENSAAEWTAEGDECRQQPGRDRLVLRFGQKSWDRRDGQGVLEVRAVRREYLWALVTLIIAVALAFICSA